MISFLDDCAVQRLSQATATGTGTVNSGIFDMANADDAMLFTTLGTANAANNVKLQVGTKSDGSDMTDVAGSKVTPAGSGVATVMLSCAKIPPGYRYVRAVVTRGASTTIGEIYAIAMPHVRPVTTNVNNTDHFGIALRNAGTGTA